MDWEIRQLQQKRNFHRDLPELDNDGKVEPPLHEALALIVKTARADQGYLELRDPMHRDDARMWSAVPPLTGASLDGIRGFLSKATIAAALASGRTVETTSQRLEDCLRPNDGLKLPGIQAVLCSPVGTDPPLGVVYLHRSPGRGAFTKDDTEQVEAMAQYISRLADRFLASHPRDARDPALPRRAGLRLDGMVGRSAAFARMLDDLRRVAPLEEPVLLKGEPGTGKRRLARVIHDNGPSSSGPFIALDCGAAAPEQVESSLFGGEWGSGGALSDTAGGTLHLYRIDRLSLRAQARLAKFLGRSNGDPARRTRLVASTSGDPSSSAALGCALHKDLLASFRLQMRLPAASERKEDVTELSAHFVAESSRRQGFNPSPRLSGSALRAIEASEWPGNLEQLCERLEAATTRACAEGARCIEPRHVFPGELEVERGDPDESNLGLGYQEATRRFQRLFVARVLEDSDWNISETARRLGLARSHVYNLVRAFGLERGEA